MSKKNRKSPTSTPVSGLAETLAKRGRSSMVSSEELIRREVYLTNDEDPEEPELVEFWHYRDASAEEGKRIGAQLNPQTLSGMHGMVTECFLLCMRNENGSRMFNERQRSDILKLWNFADIQACVDASEIIMRMNNGSAASIKKPS